MTAAFRISQTADGATLRPRDQGPRTEAKIGNHVLTWWLVAWCAAWWPGRMRPSRL